MDLIIFNSPLGMNSSTYGLCNLRTYNFLLTHWDEPVHLWTYNFLLTPWDEPVHLWT